MATINGTAANNTLNGTQQNDVLNANWSGGNDRMFGRNGNDRYFVNSAGDQVNEVGTGIDEVVSRLAFYDLPSNVENLVLDTGGLNGIGNSLNNSLQGNNSGNSLWGMDGDDELFGYVGNDKLYGGSGVDTLHGGQGNDILDGGADGDVLKGFSGNDTYYVDSVGDVIDGEAPTAFFANMGIDTVNSNISRGLEEHIENLVLTEVAGDFSVAVGNTGNNQLTGNSLTNFLYGQEGNDALKGLGGDDFIYGGHGTDTLTGGSGADTFYFASEIDSPNSALRDKIKDFKSSEGDVIDISQIDADASTVFVDDLQSWQINYDPISHILSVDILGPSIDFSVDLTGVGPGFSLADIVF
jgi:Ca2+-binding RTX toxin-like protein